MSERPENVLEGVAAVDSGAGTARGQGGRACVLLHSVG
jgi:hypothetical protein